MLVVQAYGSAHRMAQASEGDELETQAVRNSCI